MPRPHQNGVIRLAFAVSFGLSIVLAGAAVGRGQLSMATLLALVVFTGVAWWGLISLQKRGRPAAGFISLAVFNALLIVPEMALRVVDFRYESGIEFGFPRPAAFLHYVRDSDLFWTFDPADPDVNSMGFPGDEIEFPKPEGTFRILFLGDSCTYKGPRPYPDFVEEALNESGPAGRRIDCVSLSIAGYSSHQGRVLAETHGARLTPDLVVVYYGWNDHWPAYGVRDAEKVITDDDGIRAGAERLSRLSRLLQLFGKIGGTVGGSGPLDETRVTEDEYRANLRAIAAVFTSRQVPVVYITAPSSHPVLGVPDYLIQLNFAEREQQVLDRHARYTDIVREISQAEKCYLLDLEREFGALPAAKLREIFMADGIHFTIEGRELAGEIVADYLRARFKI